MTQKYGCRQCFLIFSIRKIIFRSGREDKLFFVLGRTQLSEIDTTSVEGVEEAERKQELIKSITEQIDDIEVKDISLKYFWLNNFFISGHIFGASA